MRKKTLLFIPTGKQGEIKRCGILRLSDPATRSLECHGLVFIQPVKCAIAAIDELNGRKLNGNVVDVRRYYERSAERDRRNHFALSEPPRNGERRRRDRRRHELRMETIYQSQ
ncbi:MAG: RNA-binding protein [Gammaproteobacteria bacterium]|nr:RNA-binding protein [Gammaproteobacteria bacterium]